MNTREWCNGTGVVGTDPATLERCDSCKQYPSDEAARAHVLTQNAGKVVTA